MVAFQVDDVRTSVPQLLEFCECGEIMGIRYVSVSYPELEEVSQNEECFRITFQSFEEFQQSAVIEIPGFSQMGIGNENLSHRYNI